MKTSLSALTLAMLSTGLCSATTPRTAWLIHPGVPDSPAIEISPGGPANTVTWRIKSRQGQVLVETTQPAIPAGYTINFGRCKVHGALRDDVVAYVRHAKGRQWSMQVRNLWIADPAARAFKAAKTKGVACLNESYGV